jgi:putative transcriptional regulator
MADHYQTGADLKGKTLVAHPNLPGQLFSKSVIYLFAENTLGYNGFILNKITNYSIHQMFADKGFIFEHPGKVYAGGPINTKQISLLHTDDWTSQTSRPIGNGLMLTSDELMFEKMAMGNWPAHWRFFVGLCGWQIGQLEAEIDGTHGYEKSTSWLYTDTDIMYIFRTDGTDQWNEGIDKCSHSFVNKWL